MGLTRQEINLLLAKADRNGDGSISYEEFLPLCFNILVERFSDELVREKQARSADDIEVLLVQVITLAFSICSKDLRPFKKTTGEGLEFDLTTCSFSKE